MKKIIPILILVFLINCRPKKIYYNDNFEKKMLSNNLKKTIKFPLNSSNTKVYFRDNMIEDSIYNKNDKTYDKDLAMRLKNFADYQYIIERNDTIIYISTTPSPGDITFRNYFFKHADSLDKSTPNAYYFNTFLIGKKRNDIIVFKDAKSKMVWQLFGNNNAININSINIFKNKYKESKTNYVGTISPSHSIDIGLKFKKIENFKNFYYSDSLKMQNFDNDLVSLKEIILDYDSRKKLTKIIVLFNDYISPNKNAVPYSKKRILYSEIE